MFNKCYIMFPDFYDDKTGMKIYEVYNLEVIEEYKTDIYDIYGLKLNNIYFETFNVSISFNIMILKDKSSLNKIHNRKAYICKNDNDCIANTNIIFAFNKDIILKYYEEKLNEIENVLEEDKIKLEESIKAVKDQQEVLHNNPEKLFVYENN